MRVSGRKEKKKALEWQTTAKNGRKGKSENKERLREMRESWRKEKRMSWSYKKQ